MEKNMEVNDVLSAITGLNLHTLVFFIVTTWWFTKEIKADVKEMKTEMHLANTRVSRLEGTVYGKKMYDQNAE